LFSRRDALAVDANETARAIARWIARQAADHLVLWWCGARTGDSQKESSGPERRVRRKTKAQA
jgi:hypothetical protein